MKKTNKGRWYIKHGEVVQGPFPNKLIGRYLILGRITQEVLVSQDKVHWAPVKNYPAMVPEVVKEAGTAQGDRALMLARIREDERSSTTDDNDKFDDRREDEEQLVQLHRQIRDDVLKRYAVQPQKRVVYFAIITLSILIIAGLYYSGQSEDVARLADCQAASKPGINWSGCNKQGQNLRSRNLKQVNLRNAKLQGADLSAAQLQGADLAYANLTQAILVSTQLAYSELIGADLHQANLSGADLRGANFSHAELVGAQLQGANLSDAIFDNAIWVNGETCLPGSVGACLLPATEE